MQVKYQNVFGVGQGDQLLLMYQVKNANQVLVQIYQLSQKNPVTPLIHVVHIHHLRIQDLRPVILLLFCQVHFLP